MTTEATLAEARERMHEAEGRAMEAKAILEFYQKYPELHCQANTGILREFHHGEVMTLQSLEESLQYPGLKARLATKTPAAVQKAADTEAQTAALAEKQKRDGLVSFVVAHRAYATSASKATDVANLSSEWTSTAQLEAERERIGQATELRSKSVQELRAIVRPKAPTEPVVNLGMYTREHILAMTGPEMRKAFCRPDGSWLPGYKKAVDKVLKGEN
jgi:hypothetical protein